MDVVRCGVERECRGGEAELLLWRDWRLSGHGPNSPFPCDLSLTPPRVPAPSPCPPPPQIPAPPPPPCRLLPTRCLGLEGVRASRVACGWRHSLVVDDQGRVFTFGWSKYGQLGHGDQE